MSALGAIEALAMGEPEAHAAVRGESGPSGRRLKVAGTAVPSSRTKSAAHAIGDRQPRFSSILVAGSDPQTRRRTVTSDEAPRCVAAGRIVSGRLVSGSAATATVPGSSVPAGTGSAGTDWAGTGSAGTDWAGTGSARSLPFNPVSIHPRATARTSRSVTSPVGQPVTGLRLTRRGRVVVTALIVAGVTVAALLITMLASSGAQATNSGQARAGYQGLHEIVVQPGQTLWSIASTADPSADPRTVIQEIMTANALTGPTVAAGQILWVPR